MKQRGYTPEELAARRVYLEERIRQKRVSIARHWEDIASPADNRHGAARWMGRAMTLFTVYDGIVIGYKIFRRIGSLFGRRRRF